MLKVKFIIFLCAVFVSAMAQPGYWQQQVNYTIAATLNDAEHTLDGYVKMDYHNNSPDTLTFIWIHLWQNAYKNDRTAYTDQALENGSTAFYFSNFEQRGYINRLDFRVNGGVVKMEDHPEHQDIIKIVLSTSLVPGGQCKIETPFHVKLPENFSRGGHNGQAYQVTQWYPKPAVYDSRGWHPMPYLDQGEFYSEFGNYEVQLTLPSNYIVAATGELQSDKTESSAGIISSAKTPENKVPKHKPFFPKKISVETGIASSKEFKTLTYTQNNVHDFAWFADKRYEVHADTLQLSSGRIIKVFAYSIKNKPAYAYWKNAVTYIKKTVLTRSKLLGEYPYNTVTAADADISYAGGMEYPTITVISGAESGEDLKELIEHEVGHNWLYGILASNERQYPWMDEGINTYYGTRYWNAEKDISIVKKTKSSFINKRMPANLDVFNMQNIISSKKDQPIQTSSEKLAEYNYDISAYHKAGRWMQLLEKQLGTTLFDSCMKEYYNRWKFKHPYPEDFKKTMEDVSGKDLTEVFSLLNKKGAINTNVNTSRKVKLAAFFSFKDTDRYKYIFVSPAVGYNMYDRLMVGLLIHNYTLPAEKFQFLAAPMYATGSSTINGLAKIGYHWYPDKNFEKIELAINGSKFSTKETLDTTFKKIFESFYKIVPSIRIYFKHSPRSTTNSWLDFRTYFIGEKIFDNFGIIPGDDSINVYPRSFVKTNRYLNQLSFNAENSRVLYPYDYQLQLQQGEGFYRLNVTGNYFFNYANGGGLKARLFAAKFGYIGNNKTNTYLYQPKLLGGTGADDYAYSSYFLGRSAAAYNPAGPVANQGLAAQQIMVQNGGGLKFRFDKYDFLNGQSENWVAAINLNTSIPKSVLPIPLPLSIFFDAGTYAEAWKKDAGTSRFLYTGGLQLSLFKNVLNIYLPVIYSKEFKNTLKTDPDQNKFFKKIFFSIDLQRIKLKQFFPQFDY